MDRSVDVTKIRRFLRIAFCVAWFWALMLGQDRIAESYGDSVKVFLVRLVITLLALAPFYLLRKVD